jgi:hypothetical protein
MSLAAVTDGRRDDPDRTSEPGRDAPATRSAKLGAWTAGGVDPIRRDRLILILAYALAWGALLVNRGFYWDDWTLAGLPPAALLRQFGELGMPWAGAFNAALLALPLPGLVGHIVTFGAYLASTLLLHAILRRIPGLGRMDALVAALTFAVLPVNYARIALIDLVYGLSLLAFLAATWLLIRFVDDRRRWRRVAALALFAGSFTTASMLVLYAVPVTLAGAILWRARGTALRSVVVRHLDFLVLPVAYWLLKTVLFAPGGIYRGYNALSVHGLVQVPRLMLQVPGDVLVEPLVRAIGVAGPIGIAVGAVLAVWLVRRGRSDEPSGAVGAPWLAIGGLVVLVLGVFAYLAVGRIPTIWDWSSRHQLLVPLGVGLLAAAAVRGLRGLGRAGPAVGVAVGLLFGVAVVADARTLIAYQLDWFKQNALIDAARTIPEVRTATHIRIVDGTLAYNALRRRYRFYEYNALFSAALGDTRRLVAEQGRDPGEKSLPAFIDHPVYHMGGYVPGPVDLELRVSAVDGAPNVLRILSLVVEEATGSPSFEHDVSHLITVSPTPVVGLGPVP